MPTRGVRGDELAELLLEMSDELEGRFRREFLREIEKLSSSKTLKKLLDDIETGAYESGDPIDVRLNRISIDTSKLDEVMRNAIARSAKITKEVVGLEGMFSVTNPEVINTARNLSVQLSTNLNSTARETIRGIVQDAVEGNITRVEAANRIKRLVGLIPQHAQAVDKYLARMLADGVKQTLAKQRAEKYAQRLLRYRANTIARTEIARAVGSGQTEYWKQMKSEGYLPPEARRVWITANDEKVCKICGPMDGVLADIDGFFETSAGPSEYPQASHPNCRCTAGITMVKPKKRSPIKKEDELVLAHWQLAKANPYKDTQGKFTTKAKAVAPKSKKPKLKSGGGENRKEKSSSSTRYYRLGDGDFTKLVNKQSEIDMSAEDVSTVRSYAGMDYQNINGYLRGTSLGFQGSPKANKLFRERTESDAKKMTDMYDKISIPLEENITVFRGISLPKDKKFSVGSKFTDKGFSSTSTSHIEASKFGTKFRRREDRNLFLLEVRVSKGRKVLPMGKRFSSYYDENEILLKNGTKFKVVEIKQTPNDVISTRVVVEVIGGSE